MSSSDLRKNRYGGGYERLVLFHAGSSRLKRQLVGAVAD
jgi:hypothetical protein